MLPSVTKYIRGLLVRADFILKIAVMVGHETLYALVRIGDSSCCNRISYAWQNLTSSVLLKSPAK